METNNKKIKIEPVAAFFLIFAPLLAVFFLQNIASFYVIQWDVAYLMGTFDGNSGKDFFATIVNGMLDPWVTSWTLFLYSIMGIGVFMTWYRLQFLPGEKISNPFKGLSQRPALFIVGILVLSFGAQYMCQCIANGTGMLFPKWLDTYTELMQKAGISGSDMNIVALIYAMLLGPICEELIFRGLTLRYARCIMPFIPANIIQAFLFGLLHGNMLQGIYAFVLGLILGYVAKMYDSVVVTAVIHIIYNSISIVISALLTKLFPFLAESASSTDLNPGNAIQMISFGIFFFITMAVTYAGIIILKKAAEKNQVSKQNEDSLNNM